MFVTQLHGGAQPWQKCEHWLRLWNPADQSLDLSLIMREPGRQCQMNSITLGGIVSEEGKREYTGETPKDINGPMNTSVLNIRLDSG